MGDPPRSLAFRRQRYDAAVTGDGDTVFRFMICLLDDDRAVGRADLFDIDRQNGSAGFGITIGDPTDWGRGWAPTRSTPSSTSPSGSFGWSGCGSRRTPTTSERRPSTSKAGFVREGVLRHNWFEDGRWLDDIRMAMLREEWLALPAQTELGSASPARGRARGRAGAQAP